MRTENNDIENYRKLLKIIFVNTKQQSLIMQYVLQTISIQDLNIYFTKREKQLLKLITSLYYYNIFEKLNDDSKHFSFMFI